MNHTRNETLDSLVHDVVQALEDLSAWPETQSCRADANNQIKLLKTYLHEADYPAIMIDALVILIASDLLSNRFRDRKIEGLREAWMMLSNLLRK